MERKNRLVRQSSRQRSCHKSAEKEAFAALPPEQQQSIARLAREGERHTAKIQQEIAAERKAIAEREAAIEQERAQYQEALLANFRSHQTRH